MTERVHESADALLRISADLCVLFAKAHNYRYNVVGSRAHQLCGLFKELSCCLAKDANRVEKQIRGLGHRVPTITEKLELVRIDIPAKGEWPDQDKMLHILRDDIKSMLNFFSEDRGRVAKVKDHAVEDLLTELQRSFRVMLWKICANMVREPGKE